MHIIACRIRDRGSISIGGEVGIGVTYKPQVVRRLTQRLSKASPGAYRSYIMNNVSCFTYLSMC
jgi:hypothetical protein